MKNNTLTSFHCLAPSSSTNGTEENGQKTEEKVTEDPSPMEEDKEASSTAAEDKQASKDSQQSASKGVKRKRFVVRKTLIFFQLV